jgi:hypothetical protein
VRSVVTNLVGQTSPAPGLLDRIVESEQAQPKIGTPGVVRGPFDGTHESHPVPCRDESLQ